MFRFNVLTTAAILLSVYMGCDVISLSEKNSERGRLDETIQRSAALNCANENSLEDGVLYKRKEPTPTLNTGIIKFTINHSHLDPCSISGYVVGLQNLYTFERLDAENYAIPNLPEGEYDVILTGEVSADAISQDQALNTSAYQYGARLNSIKVHAGQSLTLNATFAPLGTLQGQVKLAGQNNHEGIEVFIPGTLYTAKTDATGSFQITGLSPGIHDIVTKYPAYHEARLHGVALHAGQNRHIDPIVMVISSGASVTLLGPNNQPLSSQKDNLELQLATRSIRFVLTTSGRPKLMRIAENGQFANVPYVPFQSTNSYVFKQDDELRTNGRAERRLSIEILEGATSQLIEIPLSINYFPGANSEKIFGDVDNLSASGKRSTLAHIRLNEIPSTAHSAKVAVVSQEVIGTLEHSLYRDFIDLALATRSWEKVKDEYVLSLLNSSNEFKPGTYAVIAKFRAADSTESEAFIKLVDFHLFPKDAVDFSVRYPILNATYKPRFEIINITKPAEDTITLLDFRTTTEAATFARVNLEDAPETPSQMLLSLPMQRNYCGKMFAYMKQIHVPTGTESPVVEKEIEYRCTEVIQQQELSGKYIVSGQAANKAIFFGGMDERYGLVNGQYQYSWFGKRSCRVYDFNLPSQAENNWRDCSSGAPSARALGMHSAVFGHKMIVFGGKSSHQSDNKFDGGIFDFVTETWTPIAPLTNIPNHVASSHRVILTPSSIILLSQHDGSMLNPRWGRIYNFSSQIWSSMSFQNGPNTWPWSLEHPQATPQEGHVGESSGHLVWTGNKLVIFGGFITDHVIAAPIFAQNVSAQTEPNHTVFVYHPKSNRWQQYTSEDIQHHYNQTTLVAINENEVYTLGGNKSPDGSQIKIKLDDESLIVTSFNAQPNAEVLPSDLYRYASGPWQNVDGLQNLSDTSRRIHSFSSFNQLYWFGGTHYDDEYPTRDTYTHFNRLNLQDPATPWQRITPNQSAPFLTAINSYYRALDHNNILTVFSVIDPLNTHYYDKNLFAVYDLNDPAPQWRAYPNQIEFLNQENQQSDTASLIRDAASLSFNNNRYIMYGGGHYDASIAQRNSDMRFYDTPIANGIVFHVGQTPISLHSFATQNGQSLYLEPGQTYRLGFKLTNAQIPAQNIKIQIEGLTNATAIKSQMTINQTLDSLGQFEVRTDGSTDYLEFTVNENTKIAADSPIEIRLSYQAGTYGFGTETIRGKATATFYAAVPSVSIVQNDVPQLSFLKPNNTLSFKIQNTSSLDIPDFSMDFSGETCIAQIMSSQIPNQILAGQTIDASIDFEFADSCIDDEVSSSLAFTSPYGPGSLAYVAKSAEARTFGNTPEDLANFPVQIPDPGTGSVSLNVSGITGQVTKITIELSISQTEDWQSDLRFYIRSPEDGSQRSFPTFSRYVTQGTFTSETHPELLGSLLEQNLNGTWEIFGEDTYEGDGVGTIESVTITIEYGG